jgi:hypothetical protein
MTMRRFSAGIAVVVFGLFLLPLCAQEKKDVQKDADKDVKKDLDKDKDKNAKKDVKKDLDKDPKKDLDKDLTTSPKMVQAGQLTGKIVTIVESKRSLRLQVTVAIPQPNQGAVQSYYQAQQNLITARLKRDWNGVVQAQQQMAQHQLNMITMRKENKEIELSTTEDVKVRRMNPPEQFDEKGQPKKYTAKELKELKGKDKDPGYPAEFSDLVQDQYVTVTLVRKKDAPRVVAKPKTKDADIDLLADNLPQASMILIVREPK